MLRYLWASAAIVLLLLVLWPGSTVAVDCPHCDGSGGEALNGGDFGANVCMTCHVVHNAPGAALTDTVGINNLCQGCHVSGGMGTEVDTHGSTTGTADCDFCVYDFTTTCTACHDPHGHKQLIDNTNDIGSPDYLFRDQIFVAADGVSCTDNCPGGESADPTSGVGECIPDPTCPGTCAGNETCDSSTGTLICTCPVKYSPTDCTTCDTDYSGGTCDTLDVDCAVEPETTACGNGECVSGSTVPDCDTECSAGEFNDPKHATPGTCQTDETVCSPGCGTAGTCVDGTANGTGEAICSCPTGYASGCNTGSCQPGFDGAGCTVDCNITPDTDPCGHGGVCAAGGGGGPYTLYPTANSIAGTVTSPTNVYADDGSAAAVSSGNSTLIASGYDGNAGSGTISDVTVWIEYRTSAAPGNDKYSFDIAVDGSTFSDLMVTDSLLDEPSYTMASLSLGAISWAQVGTLAVRNYTTQKAQPDGYSVEWDVAYIIVTESGGGGPTCDISGGCDAGWAGTSCDVCDTGGGYVAYDGGCILDPCNGITCGSGSCYIDNAGNAECDCAGRFYDNGDDCSSCNFTAPGPGTCVCTLGYGPPGLCNDCIAGYHPEDGQCISDATGVCATNGCTPGTCVVNDGTGGGNATAVCDCTGRYFDDTGEVGADCFSCTAPATSAWTDFTLSGTYSNATVTFSPITNSYADGDATLDGLCEVCHNNTTHHNRVGGGDGPAAHNAGQNCMQSGCHAHVTVDNAENGNTAGFGFMPVQGTQTCDDCHLSAAGGGNDIESHRWNSTVATIDLNEWLTTGHGLGTGSTYTSGANGAGFDVQPSAGTEHGCAYCHDTTVGHGTPGNYYRLTNYDALSRGVVGEEANDVCLVCHSDGDGGYDPDGGSGYASINSTLDVDVDTPGVSFNHHGGAHGPDNDGGQLCWDCHDPHGDTVVDGIGFNGVENIKMIQRYTVMERDSDGRPLDVDESDNPGTDIEGLGTAVAFNAVVAGDTGLLDMDDFRHAPNGICKSCHTATSYHTQGTALDGNTGSGAHPENKAGWVSTDTCIKCHPHNAEFGYVAPIGGPVDSCYSCHMSGKAADVLSYTAGTMAEVEEADYGGNGTGTGHFRFGANYNSGNLAAAFTSSCGGGDDCTDANETAGTCGYCHEEDPGVANHPGETPYALGNVFILRDHAGMSDPNEICLICHGEQASPVGFDPPKNPAFDDAPAKCTGVTPGPRAHGTDCVTVGTAHATALHGTAGETAGKFCWNCHDPHGDTNDYMMQLNLMKEINTTTGAPVNDTIGSATGNGFSAAIDFRVAKGGNTGLLDFADYMGTTDSLCGNCHDPAWVGPLSTPVRVDCNWTDCTVAHNDGDGTGDTCTSCHPHGGQFEGQGTCLGCHDTATRGIRRMVGPDFFSDVCDNDNTVPCSVDGDCPSGTCTSDDGRGAGAAIRSHHVGTGLATSAGASSMGGALTNADCIVCHAEGYMDTTSGEPKTNSSFHANSVVDLRDADSPVTGNSPSVSVFPYDRSVISTFNASDSNWVTQTSSNLDPFCLSCHDTDGASTAYLEGTHSLEIAGGGYGTRQATAMNPFFDGAITNEYDQIDRTPLTGGVVDVASKMDATTNGFCAGNTSTACTLATQATDCNGLTPPVCMPSDGLYSIHAIRGASVSRYQNYQFGSAGSLASMWIYGRFADTGIAEPEGSRPQWNDQSVMSCADCHTTDGANGSLGNAHGSNSEYLLMDSTGAAVEGIHDEGTEWSYTCFQCHSTLHYNKVTGDGAPSAYDWEHVKNSTEYVGSTELTGDTRRTDGVNNIFGMTCLSCHGGSGWGAIHGSGGMISQGGGGTTPTYRFMNGANLRYYSPDSQGGWESGTAACYTLAKGGDTFGSCANHDGKEKNKDKITRPINY